MLWEHLCLLQQSGCRLNAPKATGAAGLVTGAAGLVTRGAGQGWAGSPGQGGAGQDRGSTQPKGAMVPSKGRVRGSIGVLGGTRTAVQHT